MKSYKRLCILEPLQERKAEVIRKIEDGDTGDKSICMLNEELGMVMEAIRFNEWLAKFV